jgi:phosphonoacetate hydrolase
MRHIEGLDSILVKILDDQPDREFYITADHGMSEKTLGIDLEEVLLASGVEGIAIPIIKDRYLEHHQNLGGSSYVYLREGLRVEEALEVLGKTPGVEEVMPREEAALQFQLMPDRIGDLFVLAERNAVFGRFETETVEVKLRSHGSRHECRVPIIAYGVKPHPPYEHNHDIVARLEL